VKDTTDVKDKIDEYELLGKKIAGIVRVADRPIFCLQRLSELVLYGDKTYKRLAKWIYAIFRTLNGVQTPIYEQIPEGICVDVVDVKGPEQDKMYLPAEYPEASNNAISSGASQASSGVSTPVSRSSTQQKLGQIISPERLSSDVQDSTMEDEGDERGESRDIRSEELSEASDQSQASRSQRKRRVPSGNSISEPESQKKIKSPVGEPRADRGDLDGAAAEFLADMAS